MSEPQWMPTTLNKMGAQSHHSHILGLKRGIQLK